MMEEPFCVIMEGGSPWGFSIQGGVDFRSPLKVKSVKAGGRASQSGLLVDDLILEINGQVTKPLMHMQAQQLVKQSKERVELMCIKRKSGRLSPAVGKSSPFSYPSGASSNQQATTKSPVVKAPLTSPPKPSQAAANGHACVGTSSKAPVVCEYNAKFIGFDSMCIDVSQPLEDDQQQEVLEHQDQQELQNSSPIEYDFQEKSHAPKSEGHAPTVVLECSDQPEIQSEVPVVYGFPVDEDVGRNEMKEEVAVVYSFPVDEDVGRNEMKEEVAVVYGFTEESHAPTEPSHDPIDDPLTPVDPSPVNNHTPSDKVEVVQECSEVVDITEDDPLEYTFPKGDAPVIDTANEVQVNAVQEFPDVVERAGVNQLEYTFPEGDAPVVESTNDIESQDNELATLDNDQSCQEGESHTLLGESHTPSEVESPISEQADTVVLLESEIELSFDVDQKPRLVAESAPSGDVPVNQREESAVAESADVVVMQDSELEIKVDRGVTPEQVHSDRINTDLVLVEPPPQNEFENFSKRELANVITSAAKEHKRRESSTDSEGPDPVYVIDDRGLRVRADSFSKVQSSSLSPEVAVANNDRPKSASTKSSVDPGLTTDDVLSLNKRPTSYRVDKYNTEGSRDYWKQKDQDQKESDFKRRSSQEQLFHSRQGSSSSDYSAKMSSIHPLLKSEAEGEPAVKTEAGGGEVFNRIDASKLQGALENASMLGKLEKEGVPTNLLPGVAKESLEAKQKPKEKYLKPPPGRKAKALFNFDPQSAKELTFRKGDIVDLAHTVDDNWLEGSVGGAKGIFPTAYVQVLTLDEYRATLSPEPKQQSIVGTGRALFDFQGQTDRELSFSKDDVLTIEKKIDDNWFEGFHGDKKGIFPVNYVTVL